MIFIDTGAFLARYLERDQYHEQARSDWDRLSQSQLIPYTSNFVLDELFTLLGRRAGHTFAAARARGILASKELRILRPFEGDELRALGLFEKYADQKCSFTDCVSFALMRRERIRKVFSFDAHFRAAGFELWD